MKPISVRTGLLLLALAAACKEAPKRDCPEFGEAERLLDRISIQTLDPTFGDPRYQPALAAFEAVASDCKQYDSAVTVAETIRTSMAKQKTAGAAAPAAASPPPPTLPPPSTERDDVVAYFAKMKAAENGPNGASGQQHFNALIVEAFSKGADFTKVIREIDRLSGEYRRIDPPKPCAAFHQESITLLGELSDVFKGYEAAVEAEDEAAFEAVGKRMEAIEPRLNQVERDGLAIAQRYGVRP